MRPFPLVSAGNSAQQTPTWFTILAGLLLAGYQHWAGPLPVSVQFLFSAGLLLVAGIPHGALDHLIEQERSARLGQPFSLVKFVARYVLMIVLYGAAWLLFPALSLLVFLLISAWHFGETDLENASPTRLWNLARFSAGWCVLTFILLTHAAETTPILARIVQNHAWSMHIWQAAVRWAGWVCGGWASLTLGLVVLASRHRPVRINGWRLTRLALVLGLTWPLPLLPAFMLYFGGWHALSSFGTIRSYLHIATFSRRSIWKIWQQSMPLTIVAFGFLGASATIWYTYAPHFDPLPALFILLSTITLPHIQVMHRVNTPIGPES